MNQDRLAEQHNIRQCVEQFQRVVNVMNSATANTRGQLKQLVRKLNDEGKEKQGDALDKQFQEILNGIEKLSQLGSLLLVSEL
jgi:ABC-type transporter Mla subunit MlaD